MNRLEEIRKIIDSILVEQPNLQERRGNFIHLYGVSTNCSLLAHKRGLNPEIASISGMLHDIWSFKNSYSKDHAKLGSIEARKILTDTALFNDAEIDIICTAILNHSNKSTIDDEYSEILKDADVLNHYFYNTDFKILEHEKERLEKLFIELGISNER